MLWAKLDQDGNLTIQADVPIEAFALRQWEKQRQAGKAKLVIETGALFDMEILLRALGKDMKAFREWDSKRNLSAVDVDGVLG